MDRARPLRLSINAAYETDWSPESSRSAETPFERALAKPGTVTWERHGNALLSGDLSMVPEPVVERLQRVAALPSVVRLAARVGHSALVVALALLAMTELNARHAARFARRVLGSLTDTDVTEARQDADPSW